MLLQCKNLKKKKKLYISKKNFLNLFENIHILKKLSKKKINLKKKIFKTFNFNFLNRTISKKEKLKNI
jgi:hypothetical protein